MDLDYAKRCWLAHNYEGFPREVTILPDFLRKPCRNVSNFVDFLTGTCPQGDNCGGAWFSHSCYTRVNADYQLLPDGSVLMDKIGMDLDAHGTGWDMGTAYDEMRSLVRHFKDRYSYTPRVYFSGGGFWVYVDFEETLITRFTPTVHALVDPIWQKLELITTDIRVTFDKNRISRLPGTYNPKYKKWCVPIDPYTDLATILRGDLPELEIEIRTCPRIHTELAALDRLEVKELSGVKTELLTSFTPSSRKEGRYLKYVEEVGRLMRLAPKYAEGRHRTIWCVLIPRLAFIYSDGMFQRMTGSERLSVEERVVALTKEWVLKTPVHDPDGTPRKTLDNYLAYTRAVLKQIHDNGYSPWGVQKFLLDNPELAKYWVE